MNRKISRKFFEMEIEPCYTLVYRFVYSRTGDVDLAQDLVQNTMETAWGKLEQLQNRASLKSWLMQIAMNEVRQHYRTQAAQKRSAYQTESLEMGRMENLLDIESQEASVLDVIIEREDAVRVMKALRRIPDNYRIILELRLIQDLRFSNIAKILHQNNSTVRVGYMRGLKLLQEEYVSITVQDQ